MCQETFWTLLHNSAHWEFELFLMLVVDGLIVGAIWPFVRRHLHHDRECTPIVAKTPDDTRDSTEQTCTRFLVKGGFSLSDKQHCGLSWERHMWHQCSLFQGQDGIYRDITDPPPPRMSRR